MHETIATEWIKAVLRGAPTSPVPTIDDARTADAIVARAIDEGVGALLHRRLNRSITWSSLPASLRTTLADHARQCAVHELSVLHELGQFLALMQRNRLDALMIKGTPLAYTLYPEPYLRERCDTDLVLSSKADALRAFELLKQRGYERGNAIEGDTISTQFSCSKASLSGGVLTLDIHWALNNNLSIARVFTLQELRDRAISVTSLNPDANAPCPVDALLITCLHRAAHRTEGLHNRLIWLHDIHLLVSSFNGDQWNTVISRSREKGIGRLVSDGIVQSAAWYATDYPATAVDALSNDVREQTVSMEHFASPWQNELRQFKALKGSRLRARHVLDHLFPKPDYILTKYRKTGKAWLPWLYARRITEGLRKRLHKR